MIFIKICKIEGADWCPFFCPGAMIRVGQLIDPKIFWKKFAILLDKSKNYVYNKGTKKRYERK